MTSNYLNSVTVLYPGGFKCMHSGHISIINKYLENPYVKCVKIIISNKEREGIDINTAYDIIKFFNFSKRVQILKSNLASPIGFVYQYVMFRKRGNFALACVNKDNDNIRAINFYKEFNEGGKYNGTLQKKVHIVNLPITISPKIYVHRNDVDDNTPLSSKFLRADVKNDDYENFKTNYPDIDETIVSRIWEKLKNTQKI